MAKKEFSISQFLNNYENFTSNDEIIVFEKILRLFLTRPGTDFEDKNFGCNIYQFINQFVSDLLMNEIKTECYRCVSLYLPALASKFDFEVNKTQNENEFEISIIYIEKQTYITLNSNSFTS